MHLLYMIFFGVMHNCS